MHEQRPIGRMDKAQTWCTLLCLLLEA